MSNEKNTIEEEKTEEEDKTIRFPIERVVPPKEDPVLFHCKACNHKITESMEKKDIEKNKVIPLSLGPLMVYVCPNCYTLQLPEEVFKEIIKKSTSNIIT